MSKLPDPRRELFCHEYIIDFNATRAAIAAKYSKKGSRTCGARLCAGVDIRNRIAELTRSRAEKLDVSADWVIAELRKIAGHEAVDLFTEDGNLKPMAEWSASSRAAVVGLEFEERFEDSKDGREHVGTNRKIKFADKIKALELLGRYLKLFKDQLEIPGLDRLADEMEKARLRAEAAQDSPSV